MGRSEKPGVVLRAMPPMGQRSLLLGLPPMRPGERPVGERVGDSGGTRGRDQAGWGEVSGDRLAQIEERVRTRAVRTGNNWAPLSNADVLALVEIAKAADYVIEADGNLDQLARAIHLLRRKRAALARLDSGAAEGD